MTCTIFVRKSYGIESKTQHIECVDRAAAFRNIRVYYTRILIIFGIYTRQ